MSENDRRELLGMAAGLAEMSDSTAKPYGLFLVFSGLKSSFELDFYRELYPAKTA